MGFSWSVQVMTVPLNMASGVTLRVDVKSNRDGVGFDTIEMRVAAKLPCSLTVPSGSPSTYLISVVNAGLLHSRLIVPVTMHVRVTSSLGQTAP